MPKKIDIVTASLILGIVTPAHAAPDVATAAADSAAPRAIRMTPIESVEVMLERAESLMDKKDFAASEAVLKKALRDYPDNADVVGDMGMLRLRQEDHAQAHEFFRRALQMTKGKSDRWRSLTKTAKYWWLLREARGARQARDFALAEKKLNEAIKLDPKIADSYSILGGVQNDRGQASAATAAYRKALSINPLNNEALEGLVAIFRRQGATQAQRFVAQLSPAQRNVLSNTISSMEAAAVEARVNDPEEFLSALEDIPADKRPAQISRSWGNNLEKLVDAHANSGRRDQAVQVLKQAEALAENDEEASLAVAASWSRLEDYEQADRIFGKVRIMHTPPSARWRLRHARYLDKRNSPELRAELDEIAAMGSLSSEETRELRELQESLALRIANAQIESGSPGLAHQTLAPLLKSAPNRISLLLVEARAYQAEKQWPSAESTYAQILRLDSGNGDATRGLIETNMASGNSAAALAQLDKWAAGDTSGNPYQGIKRVYLYLALGEPERAHQHMNTLVEQYPNHFDVLYEAVQMAHREGRLDEEIDLLKKLAVADRAAASYQQPGTEELGSPRKIQRDWKEKRLAALIDRRARWFSSAFDVRSRSGTAGLSQFNSVEIPLEYKTPWHMGDEVFFRADLIRLSAGNVDPANTSFGGMLLCRPVCTSAPLDQNAQGVALGAAYQRNELSADLGFTPLNFPVSNIVGGIRHQGNFDGIGYSLEASRRPVTDSLLSLAGSRDPFTGKAWGGVVATGARLGISIDAGGTFGFWSVLGSHNLTGRNVQSNKRTQVMAGEQWRMINEENRKFIVGLTGMYWGFAENTGEYTFGHGGYFSPYNYRSLSLPITYMERFPRFSYMLSGLVMASRTKMQDAQFYPTDSTIQTQASTLLAPFGTPIYKGGSSKSTGYSVTAAWEYQVDAGLFAGGLFSIDRAESYAPNRGMLYLRYSLDRPGAQPVFMPPEPVEPSLHFR